LSVLLEKLSRLIAKFYDECEWFQYGGFQADIYV